jgi:hypothetical protein
VLALEPLFGLAVFAVLSGGAIFGYLFGAIGGVALRLLVASYLRDFLDWLEFSRSSGSRDRCPVVDETGEPRRSSHDAGTPRHDEGRIDMVGRLMKVAMAGVLMFTLAGTTNAFAKSGDVVRTGGCSNASTWKLKLSPDNGKIEVEYEVDSNKAGQNWHVKLFENGNRIFRGTKTTQGTSGSFTVRVLAKNTAGTDSFKAHALNAATSETCGGAASIG